MNAPKPDVDTTDTLDIVASWDAIAMGFIHTQRRLLASIESEGLPGASFEALRLLLASDDHRMPMSRLARDLTITEGGLTKLADRLARDGLIDRRNSSDDRPDDYAALTEKGESWRPGRSRSPGRVARTRADRPDRRSVAGSSRGDTDARRRPRRQ